MIDTVRKGSVRKKCLVLGTRRQTYYQRKKGKRPEKQDEQIATVLHSLTKQFIAWGFWLIFYYMKNQGYTWNHKKVYRVWKQEGLNLRTMPKRRKIKRKYYALLIPDEINRGWSLDFMSDWIVGYEKKRVRIINIVDDCSRKVLWTQARSSITGKDLVEILNQVVAWRGAPEYIRCDNGPELISKHLKTWSEKNCVKIRFIQPGKPTQNGVIERLNGTLRVECLNLEWFQDLEHLNDKLQEWWHIYNQERPHSSIGYQTPNQFEHLNQNLYFRMVAA